jgi:hypothetical protein
MEKEKVQKIFKFSVLGIIVLILLIKTVNYVIEAKEPDVIQRGSLEAMLSISEEYNVNTKLTHKEDLISIQENLSETLINNCTLEEENEFNENEFFKLKLTTNKGFYIYNIFPEQNIIFEAYQPDIIYSVVNSNYSDQYTCPEKFIIEYKEKFKKLK